MLKKSFDWTPSDIAQWEKIRQRGLSRFILWYGLQLFASVLFLLLGGGAFFVWIKTSLETNSVNIANLTLELLFIALACLLGGVINSLLTWLMEENIYRKIMKRKARAVIDDTGLP